MYQIEEHGRMLADERRTRAYGMAIAASVREGDVVVDIGAGSGVLSLMACRAGARRVYAIEPDPVIQLARELAQANGFEDRIVFLAVGSEDAELPEPCDVMVSDISGSLPLFQRRLLTLQDARKRFLRHGGTMIPEGETVWFAPAEAAASFEAVHGPWDNRYGVDLSGGWRRVHNRIQRIRRDESMRELGPRAPLFETTHAADDSPDQRAVHTWEVSEPGMLHGLAAWFDMRLHADIVLEGGPDHPYLVYSNNLFALPHALRVVPGDRISLDIRARIVASETVWLWRTRVARGEEVVARFEQSTFHGHPILDESAPRWAADHVPVRTEDSTIDMEILQLMTGELTNAQIAERLARRYGDRFADPAAALERVAELAGRYSR